MTDQKKRLTLRKFSNTDITDPNIVEAEPYAQRRNPIFITLENPKVDPVDIYRMLEAGMNGVRLKASDMTHEDKVVLLQKVEKAATYLAKKHSVLNWPVATCIELKTGIVKSGILESDDDCYVEGPEVILTCDVTQFNKCTSKLIFVDNPRIATEIKPGMQISVDHDEIVLIGQKVVNQTTVLCSVFKAGKLKNMVIVCVRGARKQTPMFTKKDAAIVQFALDYQMDVLIVNYVRRPEVVKTIKKFIGNVKLRPMILGGICTSEGLFHIDDVIKECDGIIFSREFLAYELDHKYLQRMMQLQKWVGAKCHDAGKPYYISGGVFHNALVDGNFQDNERANVSNAVLSGVTGFVLVDCPRVEHVVEVISALNELCCSTEPFTNQKKDFWRMMSTMKMPVNAAEGAAISCALLVNQCNARLVVVPTVSGETVRLLSRLRPTAIILVVSNNVRLTRRLQTCRCVIPLLYEIEPGKRQKWEALMEARIAFAETYAVKRGWVVYGDLYVSLQRSAEASAFCDCVKVISVTSSTKTNIECPDEKEGAQNSSKLTLNSVAKIGCNGIFGSD